MTTTQVTIETAPRDLEGLKAVGRFNLRGLATQLGVFDSEERKVAFMQESNDQQAATILKLLQEKDGTSKPAAAKGAGAGGTGRSPSTKNAGKGGGAAGKPAGEAASGAGSGGTAAGAAQGAGASSGVAGDGAAKVLAAIKGLGEKYDGIKESIDELTERVGQLETISGGTNRFVTLAIGLNLKLAEQVLGASPSQVLEVVLDDMSIVESALAKLAPAVAEEDEAEEDEAEEGNDEE